jgi:DNA-binding HxlR family transcriptional regulator
MKRESINDRHCSIARAAGQLTDAWSFVILREIFLSNRRYDGIRIQTGMSPRSLALRLASLVENGVLEKIPYQDAPVRHEYRLTQKGLDLWPVIITLRQWGDKWAGPWGREGPPMRLEHKGHDHNLEAKLVCNDCGERVDARSGLVHMSRAMQRERKEMNQHATSQARSRG